MKFFALIFLFGLATASFHDILDDSDEDFLLKSEHKKGKEDLQTELGRKLRDTLDHILKDIKKTVDEGKGVSQELIDKVRELIHKLKEYGVNVSDEAKDILNYFKERAEKWVEEFMGILHDNSTTVYRTDDKVTTEFGKKLREALRNVLREIKKAAEEGKEVSQKLIEQAKDLIAKLKKYGIDVSEEIKDMIEYLKTRISKWAEELLDAWRGKRSIKEKLREIDNNFNLHERIEKLKELISGKVDLSKIKEFIQEHFSESKLLIRKFLDKLKEGVDRLKEFLDRLFHKKETRSIIDDFKNKIKEFELREKFEKMRDMMIEGVSNSKLKEFITEIIPEKLKLLKDFLLGLLEKGQDKLKSFMDRLLGKN